MISLNNISKQFSTNKTSVFVLSSISATFYKDKSYAIVGQSGSGKTTLLHILAGLETICSGTIVPAKTACMFQKPYLSSELSIIENVLLSKIVSGNITSTDYQRAQTLLENFHITRLHQNISTLSGGQQQKVAFLRALMAQPEFLLVDEPTTFLDEESSQELISLMMQAHKEKNIGLIIVTHNKKTAHIMDIVYELKDGSLIQRK